MVLLRSAKWPEERHCSGDRTAVWAVRGSMAEPTRRVYESIPLGDPADIVGRMGTSSANDGRWYFDHNATSPPDPRVVEAMLPWLGAQHGNPSSVHSHGQAARAAIEQARVEVAGLLGASALEVVFMGSGTEANNAVVLSVVANGLEPASSSDAATTLPHLVIPSFEHPSITVLAEALEAAGRATVTWVDPSPSGVVAVADIEHALRPETVLVALMLANNEVGTLQPVAEVASLCRERGVPVLCDAVQAAGKVPVDAPTLGVDWLVIAGHKFHGPLGAAALWMRPSAVFEPLLVGGRQERGRRSSTENVPAIVGLGTACRLAAGELAERARHLEGLRRRFEDGLAAIPDARVHGDTVERLPHTTNVAFPGLVGQDLVIRMDLVGCCLSTGAACASGVVEPSATLKALGLDDEEAIGTVRVSFGMPNTVSHVDHLLSQLAVAVASLRDRRSSTGRQSASEVVGSR